MEEQRDQTNPAFDSDVSPPDLEPNTEGTGDFGAERVAEAAQSGEETWAPGAGTEQGSRASATGREMLAQLQQMIDTLATQAAPVMREVAAAAAELAAVAAEKAGPLAHKAAGVTEDVGKRVAVRSKQFATDLRKPREGNGDAAETESTDVGLGEADQGRSDDPRSSDWSAPD